MKKFITAIAAILFTFSINTFAFAHSHIGETVPANGEVVTESLTELVLNFEEAIEQGSIMELYTSNGEKIELGEVVIADKQLIGKLVNPLANDEYKVDWTIISADGHPLEGSYSFTMNVAEEPVVEEVTTPSDETAVTEEVASNEEQLDSQETSEKEESSSVVWIVVGIIAIILILSIVVLSRRKK
ncbi:copper resistance protein CopC [Solibacillus sp. MA9]|uniref:Copper resistance protein CopC n=1 Tax=Solibacillus palustris TaxID=2908203 RepID=A0ABS9UIW1_9BACL|nr:copper resistance protein CopC [Solibacillus sp. MA9]MCH7323933.1 copper resistance protein CopC [Solibacillus sp. MA9]